MIEIKGITKKETMAIAMYEELLLKKFPNRISKVVLFGSKARCDSRSDSDLDLLIVLTKNGKAITQKIVALSHQPIAQYMVDISPIVVDERFFKSWSPLLEHIKKDGITIWKSKRAKKSL